MRRLCTLLRCCGQTWGRRSVHRSAKMAPRHRFGAFVYTVATLAAVDHPVGLGLGVRQDVARGAAGQRREPRLASGLRRLPGVGPGQVARPGLGGVVQAGGRLAREVHHEGAVGVVDHEVLCHAQAHALGRAPDLLSDGDRRLVGVAQRRDPDPGGGLDLDRAHADKLPGPLPVLCAQHDRRPRPRQTVPPAPALRQRWHATPEVQLLCGYCTRPVP